MANDVTCPWCGSQCTYSGTAEWRFSCGSLATGDHPGERTGCRTQPCKDRELIVLRNKLATVTDERDELRRRIDEAPAANVAFSDDGNVGSISRRSVVSTAGNYTVRQCRLVRDDQPEETVT